MPDIRGSDRLQHIRKRELTDTELEAIAGLADRDGVDLVDWNDHGIPAVEGLSVSWLVKPDMLAQLVEELLERRAIRHLDVFPLGRPALEHVLVEASTLARRRG